MKNLRRKNNMNERDRERERKRREKGEKEEGKANERGDIEENGTVEREREWINMMQRVRKSEKWTEGYNRGLGIIKERGE